MHNMRVRYCNDSRDSSFASCDFLARQSSCISALHNLTRSCSNNSETVSAYVCFHRRFMKIRWTQHRAGGPVWPLLRHFSGFQMFSSCSLSRLSKCIQCQVKKKTSVHLLLPWGPQHLQFLWLWPLWPIEMLHQNAWEDNAAQALRMCAIHACPGEVQTNAQKVLHTNVHTVGTYAYMYSDGQSLRT